MRRRTTVLTEQELEIMKIVWDLQSATVRDVYEVLRSRRTIAYTTVMTMMKILERKKYLRKSLQDRAHIYVPSESKSQVIRTMVTDFVDRVFNGAGSSLLVHLIKSQRLTPEELEEIRRQLKENEESGPPD